MSYDSQTAIANRHDYDTSFTAEYDSDQDEATIITPTSGKRIKVVGVYVSTEATSGKARIYFPSSENTAATVFAADDPAYAKMVVRGAKDEVVSITSSFGVDQNYFVLVNYKEE